MIKPNVLLQDVKIVRWELKTDSLDTIRMSFHGFKTVFRRRRRLFKRVLSLHVNGTPFTQLNHGPKETYHIVEITLAGHAVFQLLFRQSDGYLVAFRLLKNEKNLLAWEGWFHFSDPDIKLPLFFGERRSVEWACGYLTADKVSICRHTMHSLVTCVMDYKPANCTKKSFGGYDRVILFQTWMVLLGECQRSGVFVEFVELHHDSEQPSPVGIELEDHLHSWGNFCSAVLHIHLALLMRDYGERGWEEELELAESELSQAVLAVTSKGYELINRYIVYRREPDGTETTKINGVLSMPLLLGTEVHHLLHLIKCDSELVQDIHKLMNKHREYWPDADTEPDSEPDSEVPP